MKGVGIYPKGAGTALLASEQARVCSVCLASKAPSTLHLKSGLRGPGLKAGSQEEPHLKGQVAKREGEEVGWAGNLALIDANYCLWNG